MPFATVFSSARGSLLRYDLNNKHQCYLLHKGSIALHRRGDGIILNSESGPFILGISNQLARDEHLYIRVTEESCMGRMPLERFNLIIEKYQLWESLSKTLIYTASRVYEHCTLISQMSAYEIIRFQLLELMGEPASIRLNITAANYIKGRTYLSRSGIMRILAELRKAGYIELERGVLCAIQKLPIRY
ncbi:helix-turn-helix domain-containing protein [Lelliottia aquatilis]|nr:helix-turn-helix domain-containing protein [Lelliottia aquatilis]